MTADRFVGDEFRYVKLGVLGLVAVNPLLDVASEAADKALHGPGSGVSEGADGVAFNLLRELLEHVDLSEVCVTNLHTLQNVDHPGSAFSAGRALAATLVLVELGQP